MFWPSDAYVSFFEIYFNRVLKCPQFPKKNCAYILTSYILTIIFFYGMCKKEKIGAKTRFFMRHFFIFLHREHEISIFMKLFFPNIFMKLYLYTYDEDMYAQFF
jgi:hypothetical protein